MAVAYEARARITADASGFVSAARAIAQASGVAAASIRDLNQSLKQSQSSMRSSAAGAQQYANASQNVALSNKANAQSAQQAATAQNQSAQATQRSAASLTQMGQNLARLTAIQERYQALVGRGAQLNSDEARSFAEVNSAVGKLWGQINQLGSAERARVLSARDMAAANRLATDTAAEFSAELTRLERRGALTHTQLQTLARDMERLSKQESDLIQIQGQLNGSTQQQSEALRAVQGRIRELETTYNRLDQSQQEVVDSTRALVGAQRAVSEGNRQVAAQARAAASAMQTQSSAARDLDDSLWAMRSALGDLQGLFAGITSTAVRMARTMAESFSTQEMAIANLSRVTQATAIDLSNMTDEFRDMAGTIPLAFDELSRIGQLGAQVGIADQHLANFTETVALFAATTDVAADDAALMFARIVEMTDIEPTQIQNLGAAVSELGSNSAATEGEILKTTESIATVASQADLSSQMILGLGSAMASLRIRPELARGALQRIFLELNTAVQDSGEAFHTLVQITGETEQSLLQLQASNPDEFFMRVAQGLNNVSNSGQDLVPVIRELGIINTRDVDTLARLAANYDLLADQVDLATDSFARGTFLHQESARIFNTLTARVQLLANEWQEFLFNAVAAIAPFVTSVVEASTAVLEWANASDVAPWVGWGAVVIGLVGGVAALGGAITAVTQGWLAWRGIMLITTQALAANTAATAASATTTTAAAAASGRMAAAQAAQAAAVARTGASMTFTAAAANAMAAATARATAAVRGFNAAAAAGPLIALTAAIAAGTLAWRAFSAASADSSAEIFENNQALVNGVGGLDAYRTAIANDTQAMQENTGAATFRREEISAMSDADRQAADSTQQLADNQGFLQNQLDSTGISIQSQAEAVQGSAQAARRGAEGYERLGQAASNAGAMLEGQTAAIGENVQAMAAAQLEAAALESGIFDSAEAFDHFRDSGVDLGQVLADELREAGTGAEQLREEARLLREEVSGFESPGLQQLDEDLQGVSDAMGNILTLGGLLDFTGAFEGAGNDARQAADGFDTMADSLTTTSEATNRATRANSVMGEGLVDTGLTAEQVAQGFESVEEAAQAAAESFGEVITAAVNASDPLENLRSEGEALALSWQETFDTLASSMSESLTFAFDLAALQARGLSDAAAEFMATNRDIFEQHMGELAEMTEDEIADLDQVLRTLAGDMSTELGQMFLSIQQDAAQTGDQAGVDLAEGILEGMRQGEIDISQGMTAIRLLAEGILQEGDYELDPDVNPEAFNQVLEELLRLAAEAEATAEENPPTFTPEVDPSEADEQMGILEEELSERGQTHESVFTPTLNAEPAELSMQNLDNSIVGTADASNPVFEPETDGSEARRGIRSTRSSVESTARRSSPTFKARTSGAQARSDMSSILSSLRSMASTIWVNVRGSFGGLSRFFADGGWVTGPGGPRADRVPAMLSAGEFVVNARQAQRFGGLLENMNAGNLDMSAALRLPSVVPQDIMTLPREPLRPSMPTPESVSRSVSRAPAAMQERMVINVTNQYPQAEPTSVTINRSLAYAAALEGTL